jgi:hypothetical protein
MRVGDYNRKFLGAADILDDTHNHDLNRMRLFLCTPDQAHSYVRALENAEVHGVTYCLQSTPMQYAGHRPHTALT